jgi:hypothetical protein
MCRSCLCWWMLLPSKVIFWLAGTVWLQKLIQSNQLRFGAISTCKFYWASKDCSTKIQSSWQYEYMQLCSKRQPGNGEVVIYWLLYNLYYIGYYTTSYKTSSSQGLLSFIVFLWVYFYIGSVKNNVMSTLFSGQITCLYEQFLRYFAHCNICLLLVSGKMESEYGFTVDVNLCNYMKYSSEHHAY